MTQTDGTRETANAHWTAGAIAIALILGMWLFLPIPWIWDMNDPDFMPLVLLAPLLAVYGAYHLARALVWTMRARRFGESSIEIMGQVGHLGRPLTGVVRTARPLRPEGDYQVLLRCIETHPSRGIGDRSTETRSRDYVVWEQSRTVAAAGVDSTRGIPFSFTLPDKVREPQPERDPNAIRFDYTVALPFAKKIWTNRPPTGTTWLLVVSAPMPGTDFKAAFTVPVEQS